MKTTKELSPVQRELLHRCAAEADEEIARVQGEYLQILVMVAREAGVPADSDARVSFNRAEGVLELFSEGEPECEDVTNGSA